MPLGSPSYCTTSSQSPLAEINAEDAAVRNVGHVQMAGGVPHRAFEKGVGGLAAAIGGSPDIAGVRPAKRFRQARKQR